jgi:hypothetical protein
MIPKNSAIFFLIAIIFALTRPALSQSVGPSTGTVGPTNAPGGGAHDPVQRPPMSESANLTPAQCQNFLASWNDLNEATKVALTVTKTHCDATVGSAKQ